MKKISMILILVALTATVFSQTKPFAGFFRPVDKQMFCSPLDTRAVTSAWLFRPIITVSAMQFFIEKPVQVTTLSSLGTGLSLAHFIEQNSEPYMNYAFNFLVLFGTEVEDVSPLKLSLAATVTAFQYINVGLGYSFYDSKAFILTGVTFNFN